MRFSARLAWPGLAGLALLLAAQAKARLRRGGPEVRDAFNRAITALRGRARLQAKALRAFADYLALHGKSADAYAEAERAIALLDSSG